MGQDGNEPQALTVQYSDADVLECREYVDLRDMRRMTQQQAADELGYTRRTLYNRLDYWTRGGLLQKIRQETIAARIEEFESTQNYVLENWPAIVHRAVELALAARSEYVSLQAAQWLKEAFIDPALAEVEKPSTAEENYAKALELLDPLEIVPVKVIETRVVRAKRPPQDESPA